VIVDRILPLADAPAELAEKLHIHLYADRLAPDALTRVAQACFRVPGDTRVVLCLVGLDDTVTFIEARKGKITVTRDLLAELDEILTPGHWRLKGAPYNPPPRRTWNREKEPETKVVMN